MEGGSIGTNTLRQRFLGGAAWTAMGRVFEIAVGSVVTLLLARLLEPKDYGLLAMAMVVTGLVQQARDLGIGSALVQMPDVSKANQEIAFSYSFLFSSGICMMLLFVAEPIALFYRDPRVAQVIRALSVTFPLSAFTVVPKAMLLRDMRMSRVTLAQSVATSLDWITSITMACAGFGVWALVAGNLVSAAALAIGLAAVRPWPLRLRLRGGDGASILGFGGGITTSRFLWYGYSNADFLIVGRWLGTSQLGLYTMAWNIAKMPWDRLWSSINPLMLPLFSRGRAGGADLGHILTRVNRYFALWSFPLLAGLAAVADDAVPLLCGEKWRAAIAPLRLLCVLGAFRSLSVVLSAVLLSTGRIRQEVAFNAACCAALPIGFLIGQRHGPTGVALAWATIFPLLVGLLLLPPALRAARLPLGRYLAGIARPTAASLVMAGSVAALGSIPFPTPVRLLLRVAVGAACYLLMVRILEGGIVTEMRILWRDLRLGIRT